MRIKAKRKKTVASRITGIALWLMLFTGIALIVYPRIDSQIQQHKQDVLLAQWDQEIRSQSPPSKTPNEPPENTIRPASIKLPQWNQVDGFQLLGSLSIEAIDLKEPIVRGADAESLKHGAGSVVENRMPGQAGNFVLAGHRSWTFGRHFNRLAELKPGDAIDIDTSAGPYRYTVTEITLVTPDDLTVLNNNGAEADLTLITCHPKRNPTHRLIVKAKLQQQSN
ncbi:class D sortase [Cohnella silvisoli]|uniref:Class D sortase n=1 Tax=Cohnella silvisoli TaxID=2873699 RepID=A0ABV1KT03_9BACL|nr:class D sortase [Cohnella silvisoli]MCD9021270.1 class D sortase [Cohnella silvisoli]